jgi:hypothetical protein
LKRIGIVKDLVLVASLFTPLFAGLVLHGFCLRFGWLASLAVPIDAGATLRGQPLFGSSKTYRGMLAVALGSATGYATQGAFFPELQPPELRELTTAGLLLFGFAVGGASMLGELPNSLLKRQLGIEPGVGGRGLGAPIFYVLDQVDFLLGAWLIAWAWVAPTPSRVLWSVAFVLVVHQIISLIGARLGMRESAR